MAYRDGDFIRLLTIASDHDAAYGKKSTVTRALDADAGYALLQS